MPEGMTQKAYEEVVRYWYFKLIVFPLLLCVGIYVAGILIESFFNIQLGVAKKIFVGIGGVGYFIWYFKGLITNKNL